MSTRSVDTGAELAGASHVAFAKAGDIASRVQSGEISARAVLEVFLARVERFNPTLNAIIFQDFDRARARADDIDASLRRGEPGGALCGVVMTIKDSFDVAGWPTTWGVPELAHWKPDSTSLVVQRLEQAGAVIIGKTNIPVKLSDWQSYNPIYGTTRNPWDTERTPGGSSGGAAAAIAAGLCAADVCSDIGGSIRIPAHYCGISGHKPTRGIVPLVGHTFPGTVAEPDLVVAGPLARSVDDVELLFNVIAGPSRPQSLAWQLKLPQPRHREIAKYRVGVILDAPTAQVDGAYVAVIQQLLSRISASGAEVKEGPFPELDLTHIHELYIQLLRAVTTAGIPEADFERAIERASQLAPDAQDYVAAVVRATVQRHRVWLMGVEQQTRVKQAFAKLFERIDVLLAPVAVSSAFLLDEERPREERTLTINGKVRDYNEQLLWAGIPVLADLPATVVPIGLDATGLPVGIQVIAGCLEDRTALAFAREIEEQVGPLQVQNYL